MGIVPQNNIIRLSLIFHRLNFARKIQRSELRFYFQQKLHFYMMYHGVLFLHVAKFPPSLAQQGFFYEAADHTTVRSSNSCYFLRGKFSVQSYDSIFNKSFISIWCIMEFSFYTLRSFRRLWHNKVFFTKRPTTPQ